MDSQQVMSQRDLICDEELDDGEDDVVEHLSRSMAFSGKRPYDWNQYSPQGQDLEEEEAMALDAPDLHDYFSQWIIPDKQVILLCRSYASYLAAKGHAQTK